MGKSFALLLAVTAATLAGDFFLKRAADTGDGVWSHSLGAGALLYGITAIGWFHLMRWNSLTTIAVLFAASTVIGLTAMGAIIYAEKFGMREFVGTAMALGAVIVVYAK